MEKNPEIFSSKTLFFFDWRKKYMNILDDMGVSTFQDAREHVQQHCYFLDKLKHLEWYLFIWMCG